MRDKDLYAQIWGIKSSWVVPSVELDAEAGEVTVEVAQEPGARVCFPTGGKESPGHDSRRRRWRHLDTCQYKTILVADVPRVECEEHRIVTTSVPWAEPGSGFTSLFESLVIDWLMEASTLVVSRLLKLSWNAIDGIMQRAVERGLSRREVMCTAHVGVDETSFRKRHDYVTIVSDQDAGMVLYVGEDRKKGGYDSLSEEQREAIESVSMDMWPAFLNATLESIPDAEEKIAFDKFHVAKYLGEAVDKMKENYEDLKGSKTWARKGWERWLSWVVRSRLDPIKEAAKTIKEHLGGILNAIVLKISNGPAESINSRIKSIKVRSRGFRNKKRFASAIYFHLGGLDLYPEAVVR